MSRILFTCLLAMIASVAMAEESEHGSQHESAHGFHRNTIAGFIGITGEERRERAVTFGIEYERRFSETFGIAFGIERALGDLDFTIVSVPFALHSGPWTFSAGPGLEFSDQTDEEEIVVRGAVAYVFDRGGYELVPKFSVDIVDGDVVLLGGLLIGFGF